MNNNTTFPPTTTLETPSMPLQYRGAQLLYPLGPCVPRRGITGSKYHAAWPYLPFSFRRKFSKPQGLSTTLDVLASAIAPSLLYLVAGRHAFLLQPWERYFKRGHYALKIRVFQNFRQKNCSKQNMNTTFPPTTTLETPSCLYSIEALNYPLGPRVPRRRDHRVQVPCGMAVPSLFVPAQVQQAPRLVNDARRACSSPERAA